MDEEGSVEVGETGERVEERRHGAHGVRPRTDRAGRAPKPATPIWRPRAEAAIAHDAPSGDAASLLSDREIELPSEQDVGASWEPYLRTDTYGKIVGANAAAARLFGRSVSLLLDRPFTMFASAEQRAELRAKTAHLASGVHLPDWRLSLRKPTGDPIDVDVSTAVVRDESGTVVAIRWFLRRAPDGEDVADRRERAQLEQTYGSPRRTAFLAAISGLLTHSFDYERTLASLAYFSLPMLGDWCVVDVIDDERRVRRHAVAAVARERQTLAIPLRARAPRLAERDNPIAHALLTGEARLQPHLSPNERASLAADVPQIEALENIGATSALIIPLESRAQVLGAITFLMASSGRRHCEADMVLASEVAARAALLADNARLYREAERANQAKSDFLAAMSHELRTPLTAVIGYSELLAEEIVGPVNARQKEQLGRIKSSSNHLLLLVDEILAFARLEAGHEGMQADDVDPAALVEETLTIVGPLARSKELEVRVELPSVPARFTTDSRKLRQILVNLLANAVKFTTKGAIGIRVAIGRAEIRFEVWDTGIGIPAIHLRQIFDPFWQVDGKATRRYGGTGLGLSLARKLAHLLGGEVTVKSEAGVGSTFTVCLPRSIEALPTESPQDPSRAV